MLVVVVVVVVVVCGENTREELFAYFGNCEIQPSKHTPAHLTD